MPFLLHGDGVPYTNVDTPQVISIKSMASNSSVDLVQLVLVAIPKSICLSTTWAPIWKHICWSLKALAIGRHPMVDPDGKPFTDKHRSALAGKPLRKAVITSIAGDIEWYCQEFGFPYAMSNYPCGFCQADNFFSKEDGSSPVGERPFNDFRSCAAWRSSVYSFEQMQAKYKHPLMEVPGISALSLKIDSLHVIDLGVAAHLYGSLLWSLIEDEKHKLGGSRESAMHYLNKQIVDEYAKLKIPAPSRTGKLLLSNICNSSQQYPVLKHLKGRRIRHFSGVACALAKKYANAEDQASQHRLAACEAMHEIYVHCDRPETSWPADVQKKFEKAVTALLAHYGFLAKHAMQMSLKRFSIVQKHHILAHLPAQAKFLAPRMYWTYGSESFMGLVAKVGASCAAGTCKSKIPEKLLFKMRVAKQLVLKHQFQFDED